jgi:Spy/CpxP family protein refolding chaperone
VRLAVISGRARNLVSDSGSRLVLTVLAVLLATATPALAQNPKPDDAFAQALFDPQLVLRHAQTIGLTPAQRRTILDDLRNTQVALGPLQANMTEPALDLVELLNQPRIDETRVTAKMDQVLKIENEVKKQQATLLVRIKNVLTAEQQARLRELRGAEAGTRRPDDGGSP